MSYLGWSQNIKHEMCTSCLGVKESGGWGGVPRALLEPLSLKDRRIVSP